MPRPTDEDLLLVARAIKARGDVDPEEEARRINEGVRERLRMVLDHEPTDDEVREARRVSMAMLMEKLEEGPPSTPDQTADTLLRFIVAMRRAEAETGEAPSGDAELPGAIGGI